VFEQHYLAFIKIIYVLIKISLCFITALDKSVTHYSLFKVLWLNYLQSSTFVPFTQRETIVEIRGRQLNEYNNTL